MEKNSVEEVLLKSFDFNINMISNNINNVLSLTNYQIQILEKMNIDYKSINTFSELIYIVDYIFQETLDNDLEIVLDELSQRNYYENTNK